jgi:hypothetical protein
LDNDQNLYFGYADVTVDIGMAGFSVTIAPRDTNYDRGEYWGVVLGDLDWPGTDVILGVSLVSDTIGFDEGGSDGPRPYPNPSHPSSPWFGGTRPYRIWKESREGSVKSLFEEKAGPFPCFFFSRAQRSVW